MRVFVYNTVRVCVYVSVCVGVCVRARVFVCVCVCVCRHQLGDSKENRRIVFVSGKTPKNPRIQIYMDLSYIDPQARVLNYCFK